MHNSVSFDFYELKYNLKDWKYNLPFSCTFHGKTCALKKMLIYTLKSPSRGKLLNRYANLHWSSPYEYKYFLLKYKYWECTEACWLLTDGLNGLEVITWIRLSDTRAYTSDQIVTSKS